jgi:hypothetical protein
MSQNTKLITEYPFREAVAIYLGVWKRFLLTAVKTLVGIGVVVLIVQVVGPLILSVGIRIAWGSLSSALSFLNDHRFTVAGGLILLAAIFIGLRTARATSPTKW